MREEKNILKEYGTEDLKTIMAEYIMQQLIKILNE